VLWNTQYLSWFTVKRSELTHFLDTHHQHWGTTHYLTTILNLKHGGNMKDEQTRLNLLFECILIVRLTYVCIYIYIYIHYIHYIYIYIIYKYIQCIYIYVYTY